MQTVDYLTANQSRPYVVVDPANAYKLHLSAGDKVVFTHSTLADYQKFSQYHKFKILAYLGNGLGDTDMLAVQMRSSDKSQSLSFNADQSFWAVNFGKRIDWYWQNQSLRAWHIKIWQCSDSQCRNATLIKDNGQNDYLQNSDYKEINGTKSDLYFKVQGFDAGRKLIKDFGILKLNIYK